MQPSTLLFFDLETTGVDPETDRIVQIAYCEAEVTQEGIEYSCPITLLINPGIPIPQEASDIHGITDDMVADLPQFSSYAESIYEVFRGKPLAGYNVARFDVSLLWHEFARVGIDWSGVHQQPVIDAYQIYSKREKRDLAAAMQFYCGETHDGHDASQDTIAAIKVFQEQARHYQLDLSDLRKLADETNEATFLDISRKIRIGDDGRALYAFGKHRDEPVIENEKYARWMIEKGTFSTDTKRVVLDILLGTIR